MANALPTILLAVFFVVLGFFVIRQLIQLAWRTAKPPIHYVRHLISERRHLLRDEERHHRHHLKRKAQLEGNLAKGMTYHLGEDGEIVFDTEQKSGGAHNR